MSFITLALAKLIPNKVERELRFFRDKFLRKYAIEKLPQEIYSDQQHYYKVSLCITCTNRLYQLKETLLQNIKDNIDYPNIEVCLVNYNSQDGLDDYIRKNFKEYIKSGKLRYIYTDEPDHYHSCKAKNISHIFATGEIVCNVDGDNYTGKDFAFYLNYLFNRDGMDGLYHFKKEPFWGTEGRIALSKKNFMKLGGYDETFHPTGHQDHDLINRAISFGLKYHNITIENFLKFISNSRLEKVKDVANAPKSWDYYRDENKIKSEENISKGILASNADIDRDIQLYINFEKKTLKYRPLVQ